jgi:hypothetical protein
MLLFDTVEPDHQLTQTETFKPFKHHIYGTVTPYTGEREKNWPIGSDAVDNGAECVVGECVACGHRVIHRSVFDLGKRCETCLIPLMAKRLCLNAYLFPPMQVYPATLVTDHWT